MKTTKETPTETVATVDRESLKRHLRTGVRAGLPVSDALSARLSALRSSLSVMSRTCGGYQR